MREINKPFIITILSIFIIQAALFVMKAVNFITWGWGWIFAPLWVPYFALIAAGVVLVLYLVVCNIIERICKKHE